MLFWLPELGYLWDTYMEMSRKESENISWGELSLKYRPSMTDGIRAGKRAGSLGTLIVQGCAKEKVQ